MSRVFKNQRVLWMLIAIIAVGAAGLNAAEHEDKMGMQQDQQQMQQEQEQEQQFGQQQQPGQIGKLASANKLIGKEVQDKNGQNIGEIQEVVINSADNSVRYVIVSSDQGKLPVPWSSLEMKGEGQPPQLKMSKSELQNAPTISEVTPAQVSDQSLKQEVSNFYDVDFQTKPQQQQLQQRMQLNQQQQNQQQPQQMQQDQQPWQSEQETEYDWKLNGAEEEMTDETEGMNGRERGMEERQRRLEERDRRLEDIRRRREELNGDGMNGMNGMNGNGMNGNGMEEETGTRPGAFQESQTQQQSWQQQQGGFQQQAQAQEDKLFMLTNLIGYNVRQPEGTELGALEDVIIEQQQGQLAYGFVSYGGFWGIGEEMAAVPWTSLELQTDQNVALLDVDQSTLQVAQVDDPDNLQQLSSRQFAQNIHQEFGQPQWEVFGFVPGEDEKTAAWKEGSEYDKSFKPEEVKTIKGTVKSVGTFMPDRKAEPGLRLKVETDKGETVTVYCGPKSHCEEKDVSFGSGDEVTITGSKTKVEGKTVIMASEIKKDGQTLKLRDEQGKPQWKMEGQQRERRQDQIRLEQPEKETDTQVEQEGTTY